MTKRGTSSVRRSSGCAVRSDRVRTGAAGAASDCAVDEYRANGEDVMTANDRLRELLSLARKAGQPQLADAAVRERFGVPDRWPLRPGALWRARWDDVALLVLLVGNLTATTVTAMPVTFDDTGAEADTLLVTAPAARGVPLTVWRTLRRDLPLAVLDRPVDELAPAVVAWTTGGPVPDETRLGGPMPPSVAPRSPVRADLGDDLNA